MPLTLSKAADLIDLSIQDIWVKSAPKQSFYSQYYNVVSGVTDYYEKDSSITGLGYAGRVLENAVVTAAEPLQGYDKTLVWCF